MLEGSNSTDSDNTAVAAQWYAERDPQREAVYDAEESAHRTLDRFGYKRRYLALEEAQGFTDSIVTSEWWRKRVGPSADKRVRVYKVGAQTPMGPSTRFTPVGWTIFYYHLVLPATDTHDAIVVDIGVSVRSLVHEIAHVLGRSGYTATGYTEPHGPAFTRAHLDLVEEFTVSEEMPFLLRAYRRHKVEIGP